MKKREVRKGQFFEKLNFTFRGRVHSAGFTLVELWVVMAVIAVLSAILLPALAGSKPNAQVFQCLENTRRLTLAWRMYAEDNSDLMVYSSDDGNGAAYGTTPKSSNVNSKGDIYAWTWSKMDFSGANGFNWDTNADITLRPLWPYVKDATAYKCPADASQVTISSLPSGYAGTYTNGSVVPRIRSYSMSFFLGGYGGNANMQLTGNGGWPSHYPWYYKLTELGNLSKSPGPSQTFIFMDERSDCINWGNFVTDMTGYPIGTGKAAPAQYEWNTDMPASYHNYAGCLSFADGHAEIHRWCDKTTLQPLAPQGQPLNPSFSTIYSDAYGQDVPYMQDVATRPH